MKCRNDSILMPTVVSDIVRYRKLLLNQNVGIIPKAQWIDVPLHAPERTHSIPAPCPDITIGLNWLGVSKFAAAIENLWPFSCPVVDNSLILFPVFTLEAREIHQSTFYPHALNLQSGAAMLRNL